MQINPTWLEDFIANIQLCGKLLQLSIHEQLYTCTTAPTINCVNLGKEKYSDWDVSASRFLKDNNSPCRLFREIISQKETKLAHSQLCYSSVKVKHRALALRQHANKLGVCLSAATHTPRRKKEKQKGMCTAYWEKSLKGLSVWENTGHFTAAGQSVRDKWT